MRSQRIDSRQTNNTNKPVKKKNASWEMGWERVKTKPINGTSR